MLFQKIHYKTNKSYDNNPKNKIIFIQRSNLTVEISTLHLGQQDGKSFDAKI